ncbi:MAG: major facilitator transporter [Candidatus Aramenus sulfurataquae]|uniref:Major facilitator transporter n=1 Tax=Candidatus Aramenus sulfurataquae TaxID=1326980 RepID=W7KTV1_9CREN|nr:MAG: major facilitator transporter [Candidatus Aramenus sulfurataquae]
MNREVLKIAFSAFFADLGYQAVVASFPLLLVFYFHVPVYVYGVVESFSYGVGLFFSFMGGLLADKWESKKVAVLGNSLIIILSFTGVARDAIQAIALFLTGWFMRNFRSPARRKMLVEVTDESERKSAFGVLHALDVMGGMLAIAYLATFLYFRVPFSAILPFTAVPIVVSTLLLVFTSKGKRIESKGTNLRVVLGVLFATALFGVSTYSPGFPIITVTQSTDQLYLGALTYGVYLGSSALFGYVFSLVRIDEFKGLTLGYLVSALASLGFVFLFPFKALGLYPMVFLLGLAMAAAETFEPTIISKTIGQNVGRGMGYLSLARGIGYFVGNTAMGILYSLSYSYAYAFAFAVSMASAFIILFIRK